ncbi:MAG: dienelactone hydrolase family protein [Planctomycetota bacterium]|jgi:pimeloyl-ACP methyl ester carboxylesterase
MEHEKPQTDVAVELAEREVSVGIDEKTVIKASLSVPQGARGIVLFAHGSGSSRFSTRNRYVAGELCRRHLATFLIDLLTTGEEQIDMVTRELRFDIPLLTERVIAATKWLLGNDETKNLKVGYFGASTGAAAALAAAAELAGRIGAVVSRGGRPDLAGDSLPAVTAPTLLIVGGNDPVVVEINEKALGQLSCKKQLVIIPGATHLFEEPGKLELVAETAGKWFEDHL